MIICARYRTLPVAAAPKIAAALAERFGEDVVLGVPGIIRDGRGQLGLACVPGLLVPVRDTAGRIIALKARPSQQLKGKKYLAVSSASHAGPSPGSPPHVPLGCPRSDVWRLTEGEIKSDVATALSDIPAIGAAGMAWSPCLLILTELGCKKVRLAFDADAVKNAQVAAAQLACAEAVLAAGFALEFERWAPEHGKGLDDCLAGGHPTEVLEAGDALRAIREIARVAGVDLGGLKLSDEAAPADDPTGRTRSYLLAKNFAGLLRDNSLLADLARLGVEQPNELAALRAEARLLTKRGGGFSVRDFDAAVRSRSPNRRPVKPDEATTSARRIPVEINTERWRVLEETLAILPNDLELFDRGRMLVKIDREQEEIARLTRGVELRNAKGSARISLMGEAGLSCRLTAIAEFHAWVLDKNSASVSRPVHPPSWLIKAVLENGSYPGVRSLKGIAEVPFPRPDGTLVTMPGYDDETQVYYSPSVVIDPIPDFPTQLDAQEAAKVLFALVDQFPFATRNDQGVWLASLLTVLARPAISGPVPGTAVCGNKAGSGKGRLIDCISVILTGRPVPTTSYPRDEAEADKVKTAFAIAATPIIHLDNLLEGSCYGGGVLDSALTSMAVSGRILGMSKTTEGLELRSVWFLSGNNVSPAKDAYRRWLVANLQTDLERPEERRDLKIPDLLGYVRENRPALVRAALIILRAHAAAGRPSGDWAPLGSFEQWDKVVRGAVFFATSIDCNTTRQNAAEESPDRLNKLALLEAWKELPKGSVGFGGHTCEEVCKLAFPHKDDPQSPTAFAELGDVLTRFARNGRVSSKEVGLVLRGMKGQTVGGLVFKSVGKRKHSVLWCVDQVDANDPSSRKTSDQDPKPGAHGGHNPNPPCEVAEIHRIKSDEGEISATYQSGLKTSPLCPPCAPKPLGEPCNCFRLDCPACNPV